MYIYVHVGSLKSGPRCDQDNVFISHSIIGTFEEYTESRLADRNVSLLEREREREGG